MPPPLSERISNRFGKVMFIGLVFLGVAVICLLFYSIGDPRPQLRELGRDRLVITFIANTSVLFSLSIAIQALFVVFGTIYVHRPSNFAKVLLILPFLAGNIAPAAGFYALLSSQLGPFSTLPWFLTGSNSRLVVALVDVWQWTGVWLFLAFAYTERIPVSHFSQATLEGMNRLQQWKWIVLPTIWRVSAVYIGIKALDWMRRFEIIPILYGAGGPDETVKTFAMHAATRYFDAGMTEYAVMLALLQTVVLAACITIALRTLDAPKDLGQIEKFASQTGRIPIGGIIFTAVLFIVLIAPVFWLLSMSFQPNLINTSRYHFWPAHTTLKNFRPFFSGDGPNYLGSLVWSIGFYGLATVCAMLIAANETYRLIVHSPVKIERRRFAAVISVFFMPAFAIFAAVEMFKQWLPFSVDLLALFGFSVLGGYALGVFAMYAAFKSGFRRRYEQLLLDFRSSSLAFWKGIVRPQQWLIYVTAFLVFTTLWNELFLSGKWSSANRRPFSFLIGTVIQQYTTDYSTLAAGAVVSMATPLVLGGFVFVLFWIGNARADK
jgi:ABC-type sugar transport system permease subunit